MKEVIQQLWHYWVRGHFVTVDCRINLQPDGGYINQKQVVVCSCGEEWDYK